ncbi:malate dehydrogenase [Coccomyxa subellipsoidea C-169]|uniref:malate dehydrogenase n=1 Tax=Coccomyxa subellipsoidea (strain C-169) TaxID=574566 RepID=I0Z4L5_COCSC|nr:malate dehydrogenase [Coccomyxa subellipsoidea C-169]EIE25584.1 malate dehydrogenase [Coccomyxa subellipsoidea C-169]|eukprot:XP_005650128.1 malate dehydrogenase [Coccomyxa subellipsoidea C-169]
MAEVFSIIKYLCAAAAGAITAFSTVYVYSSVYSAQPSPLRTPLRILITGAAGQIGYALAPLIARGLMCGFERPVFLHMHDSEAAQQNLHAVQMELMDAASSLLRGVDIFEDLEEACKGVDVAILLSGVRPGGGREQVMARTVDLYRSIGAALEQHANRDVKVVIVPSPAHTSAAILRREAPSIDPKNITALSRLAHNRTLAQVAEQLAIPVSEVKNVVVWGNASSLQVPDAQHGTVRSVPMDKVLDPEFMDELAASVQQRGNAILLARNLTPALSASAAICDHMHNWLLGTPHGEWVSMGVSSDGSYDIPEGLTFSFPVTCQDGEWHIVQGLDIDEHLQHELQRCVIELQEECELAEQFF